VKDQWQMGEVCVDGMGRRTPIAGPERGSALQFETWCSGAGKRWAERAVEWERI
jgi:hypothetical protein